MSRPTATTPTTAMAPLATNRSWRDRRVSYSTIGKVS
jgi:hypothetical protein